MNSYNLSRKFVDFSFENPSKIKPNHYALYFFAIEHCNRLGWKKEFGLPTTMTMEAIGIRSYNTYSKTFKDLCEFGFFDLIDRSTNQYSANIIALSNYDKAQVKALDKAFIKHASKQSESTGESIDSINKPLNQLTIKPINQRTKSAHELIQSEKQISYDEFMMKNKKLIQDFDLCIDNFNSTVNLEIAQSKIEFESEQLFPRFQKWIRSWIKNQNNNNFNKPQQKLKRSERF